MPAKPNKLSQFFQELKRRKVVRVITVYAAAAFVILELTDIVAPSLGLPDWTLNFIIILLCAGFIIAIILSWIYDKHPEEGIVKTKPAHKVKEGDKWNSPNGWKIASYISFAVIIGLIVFNVFPRNLKAGGTEILDKSIAVLPFQNDSPDQENEYFINGTMESILNNLCKVRELRVTSRSSVERYRDSAKSIPDMAKELQVSYLLEGSMQKYGDYIRMTVQLIDRNDRHLWSEQYDREIKSVEELLSLQSEIALLVAEQLQAVITQEEEERIEKLPTTSLTAYDHYLKAKEEYWKNFNDPTNNDALKRSEYLYHKALEFDPEFSLAYSGLGWILHFRNAWYGLIGNLYSEEYLEGETNDSVATLTDLALQFDDQNEDALCLNGFHSLEKGEINDAIGFANRALEINPNHTWALISNGYFHWYQYDFEKSITYLNDALKVERGDLLPFIHQVLYYTYEFIGFPDKGRSHANELLALTGDSVTFYMFMSKLEKAYGSAQKASEYDLLAYEYDTLNSQGIINMGNSHYYMSHYREAYYYYSRYFQQLKAFGMLNPNHMHRMGHILWNMDQRENAMDYFNRFIEIANKCIQRKNVYGIQDAHYDLAGVYAFMGDKKRSYAHLEEYAAVNFQSYSVINSLKERDPLFEHIRHEERFQEIVRDLEAKYEAEHERVRQWLEENDR